MIMGTVFILLLKRFLEAKGDSMKVMSKGKVSMILDLDYTMTRDMSTLLSSHIIHLQKLWW